ncbi:MAG: AmmeMemoRadiSam system protein B, partial [Hyphomicrobium sp.]
MQHTRPPAVAGTFYPESADELSRDVRRFLESADPGRGDESTPKVLIAPHAGYVYSGSIAA